VWNGVEIPMAIAPKDRLGLEILNKPEASNSMETLLSRVSCRTDNRLQ